MTHDLHERLDDLVAETPAYVVPDARAAWAAGARRRTRRRVGVVTAAAVTMALLAGVIAWLPRTLDPVPADSDGVGVDGYPTRVAKPWLTRDLPARPGPVAGVIDLGLSGLRVVTARGRVYALPQSTRAAGYPIALSADGSRIAYLRSAHRFVVRDLVSGATVVAEGIGDGLYNVERESQAWGESWIAGQAPAFWAPDNGAVFVGGMSAQHQDDDGALLIRADGTTSFVPAPRARRGGGVWPAGWFGPKELVWLAGDFRHDRARWAVAVVTTLSGQELRRIPLSLPRQIGGLSQWSGSVSPDGTRMALTSSAGSPVFDLSDGAVVGRTAGFDGTCPMSWSDDRSRPPFDESDVTAVRDDDGRPMITVDPAFEASCGIWASNALSGSAHAGIGGTLFGTSNSWLSWHWREVGLGGIAGGVVLLVIPLLVRRRRKRLAPTS